MPRCDECRLGLAWIDYDNLRLPFIREDPLPENRVRDAQIGSDQNDDIRLLEIGISERRGVKSERLFVGSDSRRHALARVSVAVDHSHPEFCQRAEKR